MVFLKSLRKHLWGRHRLPLAQRQLLLQHCQSLDLITQPGDLQLPADHSLALQFLSVYKGYSCRQCRFLSCSRDNVRRHINQTHNLTLQACTDSCQTAQYWIIQASTAALAIPERSGSVPSALHMLEEQEIQRLEQLEQDCIAQEAELEDSDNSPWLRWTQWPAQFAGLPLDVIAASAVQPGKGALKDEYVLRDHAGEPFVSCIAD